MTDEILETQVNENARLELLRQLAAFEDWRRAWAKANGKEEGYLRFVPLWEAEWMNPPEMIRIAAKEARALGHVEYSDTQVPYFGRSETIAITDDGYMWIRAHDAVGEASQEVKA